MKKVLEEYKITFIAEPIHMVEAIRVLKGRFAVKEIKEDDERIIILREEK